jgi:tetratricopeptide (TPR) repeat protein
MAAGILLYLLYIVRIGGDFMSGRYFTAPLLAALGILGSIGWQPRRTAIAAVAGIVLLGACSVRPLALNEKGFDLEGIPLMRAIAADHGICDERAFYFRSTGLRRVLRSGGRVFQHSSSADLGQWLGIVSTVRGERLAAKVRNIGISGFLGGPNVHFVDYFALSDPLLARLPPIADPCWRIGHFHRATPVGYDETARTEKNCLREPHLAEYYDVLALITRGSLWDWRRLAAIWNMNLGRYDRLLEPTIREIRAMPPVSFELLYAPAVGDIAKFSQAVQQDPGKPSVYASRGVLYGFLGMNDEAIRDFDRAIQLEPWNAALHARRGSLHGRRGQWDAAVKDFDQAIRQNDLCLPAYVQRGVVYAKMGQLDRAVASLDRAIELDPAAPQPHLLRGILNEQLGNHQRAISDFRQHVSLTALSPDSCRRLTQALVNTDELRTLYKLGSASPRTLPTAIRDLAWVLATLPDARYRDGANAVSYAKLALALSPQDSVQLFDTLAAAFAEAGQFPEAVAAARQALKLAGSGRQEAGLEAIRRRLQLYETRQAYHLSPHCRAEPTAKLTNNRSAACGPRADSPQESVAVTGSNGAKNGTCP